MGHRFAQINTDINKGTTHIFGERYQNEESGKVSYWLNENSPYRFVGFRPLKSNRVKCSIFCRLG